MVEVLYKSVSAAIECEGKYLLVHRAKHETAFADHWELPGGGMEAGESHEEALRREIFEETGLELSSVGEEYYNFDYARGKGHEKHFRAKALSQDVKIDPNEHQGYKWVSALSDLEGLKISEELSESVSYILKK